MRLPRSTPKYLASDGERGPGGGSDWPNEYWFYSAAASVCELWMTIRKMGGGKACAADRERGRDADTCIGLVQREPELEPLAQTINIVCFVV